MDTNPFTVQEFDGGITDNYIDGVPNRYRYADNLVVTTNKKLYTRPGSLIFDETYYQIPAGSQRVGALIPFGLTTYLFQQSAKKLYYISSGWNTLTGPSGNQVLSAGDTTSYTAQTFWNNHLFITSDAYPSIMKIYRDGSDVFQVRNAGLPYLATSPTVTRGGAGANTYIYAFIYYFSYAVGTVDFADEGPVTYVSVASATAPNSSAIAISAIPVLVNSTTDNYATTTIKIKIYRTVAAGTTFFYVGEVTNGTTTFNDTVADATILANNITLYTTDGTLDYEPPPPSKYLHLVNNLMFYASIKDGTQELTNTIQQGVPSNPDSTNGLFQVSVDEDIVGISSFEYTPVVGCLNSMYRLDGHYERDGSGSLTKQQIGENVGLLSNRSFVKTSKGLFFAGTDGFYWTDALQILKVSSEFDLRYKEFVANVPAKISGTYDALNDRVMWAVAVTVDGVVPTENNTIYCLHLKFGIKPDACFTIWNGSTNFVPTCLTYFQKEVLRGDSRGYAFKHDSESFTDPKIDTSTAPVNWTKSTIIYLYESCAYNFGTNFLRKWVPSIIITASNETKLSLLIKSINDLRRNILELKLIRFLDSVLWGDPDIIWGDVEIRWGFDGLIEEIRRFPATGLRCTYKQIQLTNAYATVDESANTCTAIVDPATLSVTLSNTADFDWRSVAVDYYISFEADDYASEFLITERADDVLTVTDPRNLLPSGTFAWKMRGYPQGEVLNLINYVISYAMIGKSQKPYRGED